MVFVGVLVVVCLRYQFNTNKHLLIMAKFIDLYLPLIDAVQTELGCGYVEASEIVDANEVYLTDMIEFCGETNVEFLADIITTNDN